MYLRRLMLTLAIAGLTAAATPAAATAGPVMRFAERQLARTDTEVPRGSYPNHTTRSGRWQVTGPEAWTSGFLPGEMWLAYRRTRRPEWRRRAARRQAALVRQALNASTHDVGFIVLSSYARAFDLTGRPAYRKLALEGAASLASRYNRAVGATRSWGPREGRQFTVVIDNMMNIGLLFWAARHGGPREWRAMAHHHALTTLRDHVRPDGSTFHVVDYDAATGLLLRRRTHQGAAVDSTWSRGQAWAIHGFATAYRHTRDRRLLRAARRVAGWWLEHVPADGVPYWDFDAGRLFTGAGLLGSVFTSGPQPPPRDSSAAAVAASGLLDLARLEPERGRARRFRRAGVSTLRSLAGRAYLARGTRLRSILRHGTAHYARGVVDTGLIFGDYYFLEGLARARLDP